MASDAPALAITTRQRERLRRELAYALNQTSSGDLQQWAKRTAMTIPAVSVRRGRNLGRFLGDVGGRAQRSLRQGVEAWRENRLQGHLRSEMEAAKSAVIAYGDGIQSFFQRTRTALEADPRRAAPQVAGVVIGFVLGSGGGDGDGGAPDLDLMAGIGAHRSIFTHSIVIGIVAETMVLAFLDLIRTVYLKLPPKHEPIWDDLHTGADEMLRSLTVGLSAGIAYHLGIDATIDGDGSYKDLPVELPQGAHVTILAANAGAEGVDVARRVRTSKGSYREEHFATFSEATRAAKATPRSVVVRESEGSGFRVRFRIDE